MQHAIATGLTAWLLLVPQTRVLAEVVDTSTEARVFFRVIDSTPIEIVEALRNSVEEFGIEPYLARAWSDGTFSLSAADGRFTIRFVGDQNCVEGYVHEWTGEPSNASTLALENILARIDLGSTHATRKYVDATCKNEL